MYELLSRVPEGVKPLLKILEDYVAEVGLKEVEKLGQNVVKNPQEFFDLLILLHTKYMGIVSSSFKGDAVFSASIDRVIPKITPNFADGMSLMHQISSPPFFARPSESSLTISSKTLTQRVPSCLPAAAISS